MAIFGIEQPKFTDPNETETVLLSNSVTDQDWTQPNEIEQQSIIDGTRNYVKVTDDFAEFIVTVHLHLYDNPENKFREIHAYNHQDVYFYPHKDYSAIMDSSGNKVLFHITEIKLAYLEQPYHYDVMTIRFRSKTACDISKAFELDNILGEKDKTPVTDKDGGHIKVKKGPALDEINNPGEVGGGSTVEAE